MTETDGKSSVQVLWKGSFFPSPAEGGGAWEPDQKYAGWQWRLARTEGGNRELLTRGQ